MEVTVGRLRQGLEKEEFVLHYQPKYDLFLNRVTGVEALIRWNPQNDRFVPPNRFLPVAEASGLIADLGSWVKATGNVRLWL